MECGGKRSATPHSIKGRPTRLKRLRAGAASERMRRMKFLTTIFLGLSVLVAAAADFKPAPQQFRQEVARAFTAKDGLPTEKIQLIECGGDGVCRVFAAGRWYELRQ